MPSTGILDTYSAKAAYALRLLKSAYTGYCLRVRRSSDNSELDIGFDGSGIFNWSAATTFASGGNLFVKTWYDQSGNALDLTQSTSGSQPQLDLTNHEVIFDGSDDFFQRAMDFSSSMKMSIYSVIKFFSNSGVHICYSLGDGGTNFTEFANEAPRFYAMDYNSGAYWQCDETSTSTGVYYQRSTIIDRALTPEMYHYRGGTSQGISGAGLNTYFPNNNLNLGCRNGSNYFTNFAIKEFIIFLGSAHNSTDRGVIESDINGGLGVTPPDTIRPSDVTNLAVTKNSETSISITSDDATDDVAVTEYVTEVSEDNFSTHTTLASTAKNITFVSGDTGFPTSIGVHSLKFRRKAKDGAGNVSLNYSNIPSAVTITILPSPPVAGFAFTGLNGEGKLEASDNLGITDSSTGSSRTYQWKVNGTIVAPTTATPNLTKFLSMGNNTIRQTVTNDGGNDYVEHTVNVIAKYFDIAGGTETKVITGLQTGLKLKGSVKAVDNVGNESDYSNEDSATVL